MLYASPNLFSICCFARTVKFFWFSPAKNEDFLTKFFFPLPGQTPVWVKLLLLLKSCKFCCNEIWFDKCFTKKYAAPLLPADFLSLLNLQVFYSKQQLFYCVPLCGNPEKVEFFLWKRHAWSACTQKWNQSKMQQNDNLRKTLSNKRAAKFSPRTKMPAAVKLVEYSWLIKNVVETWYQISVATSYFRNSRIKFEFPLN